MIFCNLGFYYNVQILCMNHLNLQKNGFSTPWEIVEFFGCFALTLYFGYIFVKTIHKSLVMAPLFEFVKSSTFEDLGIINLGIESVFFKAAVEKVSKFEKARQKLGSNPVERTGIFLSLVSLEKGEMNMTQNGKNKHLTN